MAYRKRKEGKNVSNIKDRILCFLIVEEYN